MVSQSIDKDYDVESVTVIETYTIEFWVLYMKSNKRMKSKIDAHVRNHVTPPFGLLNINIDSD